MSATTGHSFVEAASVPALKSEFGFPFRAQIIEDGAVWAMIATADLDQMPQGGGHCLGGGNSGFEHLQVCLGEAADLATRPPVIAPQRKKLSYALDREAERPRAPDEPKFVNVHFAVGAIAIGLPLRRSQQTDALVVADRLRRYARASRRIADPNHEFCPLDLPTTGSPTLPSVRPLIQMPVNRTAYSRRIT